MFVIDKLVFIATTDEAGTIQGHIETTDDTLLAWAEETIDRYVAEAQPVRPEVLTV